MQKVQRWSQPFWTSTKARAPTVQTVDQVPGAFAHRHDVVDLDPAGPGDPEIRIGASVELFGIAQDEIDFIHGREGIRVDLRGAAGDHNGLVRVIAARLADRLTGLPHRFVGNRAGIDQNGIAEPRLRRRAGASLPIPAC